MVTMTTLVHIVPTFNVATSAQYIAENSDHVSINYFNIKTLAQEWKDLDWSIESSFDEWKQPLHPFDLANEEEKLNWILLIDILNFSFFGDEGVTQYTVDGYTGYWSLCAALKRAYRNGIPITSPAQWPSINWKSVFESDNETPIPLYKDRINNILTTSEVLISKYDGSFSKFVVVAAASCQNFLRSLYDDFPHFRDTGTFKEQSIYIMKRAQILVADIWAAFEGKGLGKFFDIETITMFADYRVPQSLAALGMIEYDNFTLKRIENEIEHNDPLEIEIRGNSIHSVEVLKGYLQELGVIATSITLDFYLWKYAKTRKLDIPIHKTRCIYY